MAIAMRSPPVCIQTHAAGALQGGPECIRPLLIWVREPGFLSRQVQFIFAASLLTVHDTTRTQAAAPGFEWMQIVCKPCSNRGPEAGARAFVMGPTPLSMVVCTNRLQGRTTAARRAEMEEILTHEFMHVYDVRQYQLDLRACENLAYSEVRAARQAECVNSWTPQSCTRVKAQTATQNLFPTTGAWCMRQVWERAYKDTRPFGPTASSSSSSSSLPPKRRTSSSLNQRQPTSSR